MNPQGIPEGWGEESQWSLHRCFRTLVAEAGLEPHPPTVTAHVLGSRGLASWTLGEK